MTSPRNRLLYFAFAMATVVVGLATRRYGTVLPTFIGGYAPDALWALMVFWLVGILWARARTVQVAIVALGFSYAIEISQLFHPAWLDAIRHTRLGGLVLGFGFLWTDIVCYTVGVGVGMLIEQYIVRLREAKIS